MKHLGAERPALLAVMTFLLAAAAPASAGSPATSQAGAGCQPGWLAAFGALPGIDGELSALEAFDDGTGSALYAGGWFSAAGNEEIRMLARWDGASWSRLGEDLNGAAETLLAANDGTRDLLYAGGSFGWAGTTALGRVGAWDGTSWSPLGQGLSDRVLALCVHDDGSGAALYAGGLFLSSGATSTRRIARWDGSSWSPVGGGIEGPSARVLALAVFDDGGGPALYAGGAFTSAGGVPVSHIAKWDGTSWSALGQGLDDWVTSLAVHDDGSGPALYAGGLFQNAGGASARRVARWDGSSWSRVGTGFDAGVQTLLSADDGSGTALFAGGGFTSAGAVPVGGLAKWNGSAWSGLDGGVSEPDVSSVPRVLALAAHDDGGGPALFAAGDFRRAGDVAVRNVARWSDGWSALGTGPDDFVDSLAALDVGDGEALYAGGSFASIAGQRLERIGRWDGASWSPLGAGCSSSGPGPARVRALCGFDEGGGVALYAGGAFDRAGDVPARNLARWDGQGWSDPGGGVDGQVLALAVFDDGAGDALYVGGAFSEAGGVPAASVARWDGASWSPLGGGTLEAVRALAVFDDGGGPALFAGGSFTTIGGVAANRIARWDGASWSPLGAGVQGPSANVTALTVFDDGGGPALYAGGTFTSAGGVAANHVAKWDGASWSAVASPLDGTVSALHVYDDGSETALFAAGFFLTHGGASGPNIARWDGSSWSGLGAGLVGRIDFVTAEGRALAVFDPGSGPELFVGGSFLTAPSGDTVLARWGGCAPPLALSYCFGEPGACPCGNPGAMGQGCANSTGPGATLFASGSAGVASDDLALLGSNLVPNQSALLFGADNRVNGGQGVPFGDGLRCAGGNVRRLGVRVPAPSGAATWGPGLASQGGYAPGEVARFQLWYRDAVGSPCGSGFNLSHGLELVFEP